MTYRWLGTIKGNPNNQSIIKGNPNKLSYKIYQIVRTYSPGNSWITKIESILQDCGMANLWITQDIPSKKWVQCSVKRTLSDHYFQEWLHLETTSIIRQECTLVLKIILNLKII